MNIYALDEDPALLVQCLTDRHLSSTLGEAAELLCAAHVVIDGTATARERIPTLVLPRHELLITSDPWLAFTCASVANYDWISQILWLGCDEFQHRSQRLHSYAIDRDTVLCLRRQLANTPLGVAVAFERSQLPVCVPELFRSPDPVKSYRRFYAERFKDDTKAWTSGRMRPSWMVDKEIYA